MGASSSESKLVLLASVTDESLVGFLEEMSSLMLLAFRFSLLAPSEMACAAFSVSLETLA
jgi:hypothetical protein